MRTLDLLGIIQTHYLPNISLYPFLSKGFYKGQVTQPEPCPEWSLGGNLWALGAMQPVCLASPVGTY